MEAKLCIYICNSLVPEVSHLLQTGNYPDVVVKSFPAICMGVPLNKNGILEMVRDDLSRYSKIIVIVSSCYAKKKIDTTHLKNVEIVQLEQCFEILFSLPTIYHFIKQGNYLVTNGWLRNYQRHVREWGFDKQSGRTFFGESMRQILLLETGLPGDYRPNLEALSEYMGLPFDIMPIGTSHLQKFIEALIFNWRSENERTALNERIAKITRESADYSVVFSQLKRLIDLTDENLIEKEIANLLDLLFMPQEICFQQFVEGKIANESCFKKAIDPLLLSSENSFTINIEHRKELLGIFKISGIQFPQFIPQYNTMGQVISQIGGLSIENARKYSELEQAKLSIADSEARFKAIMKQSPSVIEMYDLDGLQRSVNRAYEELWGFPASHTVNQFNVLKSEEVKRTGLIDYVLRAYNGESVQIPEYRFNSIGKTEAKGKGRERWLNTRIYPLKDTNNQVQNIIITHEDITAQKEAALKIAESNQKFRNLSQSATEMLNMKSVEEIYSYLTNSLHQQYPKSVVLFSTVNEQEQTSTLIDIKGVSQRLIEQSIKITGYDFFEKKYKLVSGLHERFRSGIFHQYLGGLAQFSGSEFPKIAGNAIEKLLGIHQIYTIGITKDEKLFAIIHFFNRSKQSIADSEYIESFVKQAGIVIERKKAEELLRQSEEKYRLITENASDVIWILNISKGKFTYISPAIQQLRGLTVEEALAETLEEALTPESAKFVFNAVQENIQDFIANPDKNSYYINQVQQPCKDGNIIWVEVSTKLRFNKQDEIEVVGVSRNIEERKKMEAEIRHSEARLRETNATKDKFFSIISHDLRSPFASIMGLAELMTDNFSELSADELHEFAFSIQKTTQSTYHLLENLLEWSRLQQGVIPFNPQLINVKEEFKNCDDSTVEMARKKSITIDMDIPDGVQVFADRNMLRSVMRNLVTNAIKFTEQNGSVSVNVQTGDENMVQFSVQDTGIGMDVERIKKLFRIDTNVSRPGTNGETSAGLGLILCKEFVEKQGGKIWVESEEGKGSTFYFTIPQI